MDQTERTLTREERKRLREQEIEKRIAAKKEEGAATKERKQKPRKLRTRLIPIWLRVIIVLVLIVAFFIIGTMIGYGVIGDGDPADVLKKETWTHIQDIINKGTPNEE